MAETITMPASGPFPPPSRRAVPDDRQAALPGVSAGGDEEVLVRSARAGDAWAVEQLYRRHAGAVRRAARAVTSSASDADDLVSEAFVRFLERLRRGGGVSGSAVRAYLCAIARHAAYDRTRRGRKIRLVGDDLIDVAAGRLVSAPGPQDVVVAGYERQRAVVAFRRLPESWRNVLWDMTIQGRSASELAAEYGMTRNAVSALAYRAREGLFAAYQGRLFAGAYGLSRRELNVVMLTVSGADIGQCATVLNIKPATARKHLGRIYRTLQVESPGELLVWAGRHGLIDDSELVRIRRAPVRTRAARRVGDRGCGGVGVGRVAA